MNAPERETMEVDVLFVGAGPATLASAYHLMQTCEARGAEPPAVLVIEKGAEVGDHMLSGAVVNPKSLIDTSVSVSTCAPKPKVPSSTSTSPNTSVPVMPLNVPPAPTNIFGGRAISSPPRNLPSSRMRRTVWASCMLSRS